MLIDTVAAELLNQDAAQGILPEWDPQRSFSFDEVNEKKEEEGVVVSIYDEEVVELLLWLMRNLNSILSLTLKIVWLRY